MEAHPPPGQLDLGCLLRQNQEPEVVGPGEVGFLQALGQRPVLRVLVHDRSPSLRVGDSLPDG